MENMIQNTGNDIEHSPQMGEFFGALAKAQRDINGAIKGKKNPFFKSNYADLPAVWDACRDQLTSNGFSVVQTVSGSHEEPFLTTVLGHTSNQWIKSKIPLILAKKDTQAMGSAITYARRYSLMAIVGVCAEDEDDDGEAATKPMREKEKRAKDEEVRTIQEQEKEILDFVDSWKGGEKEMTAYINSCHKIYKSKTTYEIVCLLRDKDKAELLQSVDRWKQKVKENELV